MPSWTKDQEKAIYSKGGKIIVSAAAGSGKTAVLSERVIEYILNGGNVNDLLIVTFTNAAAFEMKIRIKDKIESALLKDPNNKHLLRQLSLVEIAKITTMDAFYGDIVKENFTKLGIDKNFDILSNEEEKILKEKVLDKVIEYSFDNINKFEECILFFAQGSIESIKEKILKVSSFLDTTAFSSEFIKQSINNYSNSNFYKELFIKDFKDKVSLYEKLYMEIISELELDGELNKVLEIALNEKNIINNLLNISNLDELSTIIKSISFDTLRVPKDYKDESIIIKYKTIRDDLKKYIKDNLELGYITEDVYKKEEILCKDNLITLFDVVTYFKEALLKEKKSINSYSFSDIAHFVIELLVNNGEKTTLAKELSGRFDEILIDEYQDTNNLQNVIFNAISKNNSNLFIVGDVKQSIYRFRSACPEIFNNDKNEASKESFPKLITLSKNFRSRKEVLDFCNFIFENTMSNIFGEVNYNEDEKLYLGANFKEGKKLETEVYIIDGEKELEEAEDELTNYQKEAKFVSEKIKELIDSKYQVYDNKKGETRCIKPSDIVILLRSLKNSDLYIKALNKRNISVYCESSNEYFDNYEIKLVINMLKVIDNPYDDIALMTLLNSDLIDINLNEISNIKANNKFISVYENLINSDNEIIKSVLIKLNELKNYSYNNSIDKVLNKVYKEFDVISIISAIKGGEKRNKNLIHMLNHAIKYKDKSLHEFITYLENIILNKTSLEGINPLSEGDNVLITTIHKSKGLEYPVVILSETGRKFNFQDVRSDFAINDDLKVTFDIRNSKYKTKYESLPMMVYKNYEISKMLSEELRVLYVALTRAKEKIIITGYTNSLNKQISKIASKIGNEKLISNLYLNTTKSYLDIIMPCLLRHKSCNNLRDYSMVDIKVFESDSLIDTNIINACDINESEFNKKDLIVKEEFNDTVLNDLLNYEYNSKMSDVPAILSVSEIKSKNKYLKRPNFMTDGISHTNIGTLYHKVLENLPVKKYNINELKETLDSLVKENIISNNDLKLITLDKIFMYLTSDIYDLILLSNNIKREYNVTFKAPLNLYDSNLDGEVLTEGVIDLLFELDDTYYIVDYKTDNVDDMEELKELYKVQLDLYEIAIKQLLNAKKVKKYIYSIKLNKFKEV